MGKYVPVFLINYYGLNVLKKKDAENCDLYIHRATCSRIIEQYEKWSAQTGIFRGFFHTQE
jgi:hypothetical protein